MSEEVIEKEEEEITQKEKDAKVSESHKEEEAEKAEKKKKEKLQAQLEIHELEQLENTDYVESKKEEEIVNNDVLEVAVKLSDYFYGTIKRMVRGTAKITFVPTQKFAADKYGMIHSGIIESAGHFCALIAINHPNGVVSRTQSEFLTPIKKNMILEFEAHANYNNISQKAVKVVGKHRGIVFYESVITILTMPEHPFENTIIGDDYY